MTEAVTVAVTYVPGVSHYHMVLGRIAGPERAGGIVPLSTEDQFGLSPSRDYPAIGHTWEGVGPDHQIIVRAVLEGTECEYCQSIADADASYRPTKHVDITDF